MLQLDPTPLTCTLKFSQKELEQHTFKSEMDLSAT